MNRTLIKSLVVSVLMLALPCIAKADLAAPHTQTNFPNNACQLLCHTNNSSLSGAGKWNNACMTCHRPGMSSKVSGQITPFTVADFANPFQTYTAARPGTLYQTSHNWSGSDNVPKAGAQAPVAGSPLNGATIVRAGVQNQMACIRCHDPHNYSANASAANHFLRKDNTNDALCIECHVPRNTGNALTGSHPINVSIPVSGNFNNPPLPPNSNNPTATPKMMANGNVGCTSCHGVHMSDSNSATFDHISSGRSARFGSLSTSQGFLLRASLRGGTAVATNTCTTCHASKMSHNGANQNVQCADCHGGHVDAADGSLPNKKLVRRYLNFSTAAGAVRKTVYFQYTGASANFRGTDGICVACHQVPLPGGIDPRTGATYPPEHNSTNPNVCKQCHFHTSGSGSFSGGCLSCHGYPPQTNTVGGSTGKAAGYSLDESQTAHKKHYDAAYGCVQCHYPGQAAGLHANGAFQNVFNPGYTAGTIGASEGLTPTYNSANHTCSNVYCHSNGKPAGGALVPVTTPNWVNGTVTCGSCHEASPTTNAHQAHITVGYGCQNCHNATTQNGTAISNPAKHANDVKDIKFYSATLTNINGGSNCSTVYCHSNGKGVQAPPTWTTVTGKCGICHGADSTAPITSGAHQAHLARVYGPALNNLAAPTLTAAPSCATCHTTFPTDHLNGSIQSPNNCTATCHPQGTGTANWTSGTRISNCLLCHSTPVSVIGGKTAPVKSNFATTGHGQFSVSNACTNCHDNASAHIGLTGGANRLIGGTNNNTVCANCHNDPLKVANPARQNMLTHFTNFSSGIALATPKANMVCATCHDTHGTSNLSMIRSEFAFINSTTWTVSYNDRDTQWVNTTTNRGLCQVCHTKTNHFRAGRPESQHYTTGCFSCHNHKDERGAFKPKGDCDSCHGYPPAPRNVSTTFGTFNNWSSARFEDYSGGGGAHLVAAHIPPTAKRSQGWANCSICHDGAGNSHAMITPVKGNISNVTVKVDQKFRFSEAQFIAYTGAKLTNSSTNKTGSCFNVSCHFQKSPKWSTEK